MAHQIEPFRQEHASATADIHAAGLPDGFLTSLGHPFLRALYAEMARSRHCFGYVAVDQTEVIGGGGGTVDSTSAFSDLLWRRGLKLAIPVAAAVLRGPSLIPKVLETLFYPAHRRASPGEAGLLFIGARPGRRGEGVARSLFGELADALRERGVETMSLIVDDENRVGQRFYDRNDMKPDHPLTLYGRRMHRYVLPLQGMAPK